jgi:ribosomal protein S27AE
MSTKFYCKSEFCTQADHGPFILELAQEAVLDGNNLATIFCPRCGNPLQPLSSDPQKRAGNHRFYCHGAACSSRGSDPFFLDLPGEAIMDQNNLAAIFCPQCGKEMQALGHEPAAAVNG